MFGPWSSPKSSRLWAAGGGWVVRSTRSLAKNVDGDPDEDDEDATDAYHREHPVVHYLAIWIISVDLNAPAMR